MLLPFYVGDVFGRVTENRRAVLEMSQKYLNEFLKLVDHYTLLDKDVIFILCLSYLKKKKKKIA